MPEHDDAYYQGQFADRAVNEPSYWAGDGPPEPPEPPEPPDRAVNEIVVPDQTKAEVGLRDFFTLRFTEHPVVDTALVVSVEIGTAHAGDLILAVDEWDRIWRSLVDATGSFDRRGISLVRTHPPSRF